MMIQYQDFLLLAIKVVLYDKAYSQTLIFSHGAINGINCGTILVFQKIPISAQNLTKKIDFTILFMRGVRSNHTQPTIAPRHATRM
jgi:hypothetical protein